MRRLAVAASCALLLAPAAPAAAKPKLTKAKATAVFVSYPKVAGWLKHYPPKTRTTEATLSKGVWTVKVWLWYFNDGRVFASAALVYPPLAYLLLRMLWAGVRPRPAPEDRPLWPIWLLAAATVFLAGFRIGLNVEDSNVIDVGYSGVV